MFDSLKQCPFCGGRPETYYDDQNRCRVYCCECFAETASCGDWYKAIKLWNNRKGDQNE